MFLAPQVGLEPTTLRLTAECSAIELLRNITFKNEMIIPPLYDSVNPFLQFFSELSEKTPKTRLIKGVFGLFVIQWATV